MAEIVSLADAISALVRDGDTVALEGFTHLIPHAAGHEIIRQRRRELALIRMTPDVVYDQLIGAGCARSLTFSWGGNPGVGSLHRLRCLGAVSFCRGFLRKKGGRGSSIGHGQRWSERTEVAEGYGRRDDRTGLRKFGGAWYAWRGDPAGRCYLCGASRKDSVDPDKSAGPANFRG